MINPENEISLSPIELKLQQPVTHEFELEGVNFQVLVPPQVKSWLQPTGIHRYPVTLPNGRQFELSWLLGAKKDKPTTADSLAVIIGHSPNTGLTLVLSETQDFLTPHPDTLNQWLSLNRYKWSLTHHQPPQSFHPHPDILGNQLMRRQLTDKNPYTQRAGFIHLAEILKSKIDANRNVQVDYTTHYPDLELLVNLMGPKWLESRNAHRWQELLTLMNTEYAFDGNIHRSNIFEAQWRHYWLNAIFCIHLAIITIEGNISYGFIRSNADISQAFNSDVLPYPSIASTHHIYSFPNSPSPINADINRLYDNKGNSTSLTEPDYHDKCAPEGIYACWGPEWWRNQEWINLALARSDHQTFSFSNYGNLLMATATDGVTYQSRDLSRQNIDQGVFPLQNSRLYYGGPQVTLNQINQFELPDDYAHMIIEIIH